MNFEALSGHRAKLGESPFWSQAKRELLYVDVHSGEICAWTQAAGTRRRRVADRVTFVLPTEDGGLVLGMRHGLAAMTGFDMPFDGDLQPCLPVEADRPTTSVNDARADRNGRLWFGTLEREKRAPICALYRWTKADGITAETGGVALSNGIQWSPNGDVMYFVDSQTQRLDAFEYDQAEGRLGRRRTVAAIAPELGMPDGLNVDAEGMIYVALYGGGAIHRYTPDGRLERIIRTPVDYPTSLAFGGDDLRTLYVTSSSVGHHGSGGAAGDAARPHDDTGLAGAVLVAANDIAGQPSQPLAASIDDFSRPPA